MGSSELLFNLAPQHFNEKFILEQHVDKPGTNELSYLTQRILLAVEDARKKSHDLKIHEVSIKNALQEGFIWPHDLRSALLKHGYMLTQFGRQLFETAIIALEKKANSAAQQKMFWWAENSIDVVIHPDVTIPGAKDFRELDGSQQGTLAWLNSLHLLSSPEITHAVLTASKNADPNSWELYQLEHEKLLIGYLTPMTRNVVLRGLQRSTDRTVFFLGHIHDSQLDPISLTIGKPNGLERVEFDPIRKKVKFIAGKMELDITSAASPDRDWTIIDSKQKREATTEMIQLFCARYFAYHEANTSGKVGEPALVSQRIIIPSVQMVWPRIDRPSQPGFGEVDPEFGSAELAAYISRLVFTLSNIKLDEVRTS